MFGYIRPLRDELLIREFNYYRSIYCGICKSIGRRYGQLPRLGITYDLAFYTLFAMSFASEEGEISQEHCIIHPITKRPVMSKHQLLDLAADLTVILAYYKGEDDWQDQKRIQGAGIKVVYRRAFSKARNRHPELTAVIAERLQALTEVEAGDLQLPVECTTPQVAETFGLLMGDLIEYVIFKQLNLTEFANLKQVFTCFGIQLGAWIYLIDAIDDYVRDRAKGEVNYYVAVASDQEMAVQLADFDLQRIEQELDRLAALLPYRNNGSIVHNFICRGLPNMRRQVLKALKSRSDNLS